MNLNFNFLLGLGLLLSAITFQAKAQDSGGMDFSLQQTIIYAMEHQADVKNATLDEEIAKAQIRQTTSIGLPQVNGQVSYTDNYKIPNTVFNGETIQLGAKYQTSAGVTLTQLIFDGSFFIGVKAAKVYKELATKNGIKTKIEIKEAVTKAYYTVLVNEKKVTLASHNLAQLDSLLRETRIMYENGFAEQLDVDRVQVQFNNAQTGLMQAESLLEVSTYLLKYQMGMPISESIHLTDKIKSIDFNGTILASNIYEYADRIEFSALQTSRELKELEMKGNKALYLPTLSAVANYSFQGQTNQFENTLNFSDNGTYFSSGYVGLQLNVPIFDGLKKHYTIQQNKKELEQIKNQFQQLANGIDLEVAQSRSNLSISVAALEVQQENKDLALRVYEQAKIKYQEGVGSNLEVVDAEDSYQQAETNYYDALYDALINKVELEKAVGIL
ncbi:TolC family protein [Xanthovirga aplysinae]|uniref:TolC family protein n=1 Tax=Xanthovirga aplysinae TaxID=2529853 RepID=UPI0012BD5197|nr:TolC family protein [Xanthovirga aplysinae]MTI30364.1 TolC family protein [Xanthovirga aplysinae]